MKQHKSYTAEELRYLRMLSRQYPTLRSAGTEIINLQAILNLPKGCEHFISDVHGEHEAFLHILNSCSGVIRERLDMLFKDSVPHSELDQLTTLIIYPEEKLEQLKPEIKDLDEWYRITLYRLIELCRSVSSRYSRSKVRKALPADYEYIIEELLHTHSDEFDKQEYYKNIISTIVEIGQAPDFIASLCAVIKRLAVDHMHIVGDIFDRGPRAITVSISNGATTTSCGWAPLPAAVPWWPPCSPTPFITTTSRFWRQAMAFPCVPSRFLPMRSTKTVMSPVSP